MIHHGVISLPLQDQTQLLFVLSSAVIKNDNDITVVDGGAYV